MSKLRTISIQQKLNKISGLSLILSLFIMALAVNVIEYRTERASLLKEIQVLADIVGTNSIAPLRFYDTEAAARNLESAKFHLSVDSLCLYDVTGKLFAMFVRPGFASCAVQTAAHQGRSGEGISRPTLKNGKFVLEHILQDREAEMGKLVLRVNQQSLIAGQVSLTIVLIAIFTLAFVFSYLLTRGLIGKLLRPLNALYQTVSSVSSEGIGEKRTVKMSDDEVGTLVDAFNNMLDRLAQEHNALLYSESRFRILAENAPIGIYLKDTEGNLLYVNERWLEITGLTKICDAEKYIVAVENDDVYNYRQFLKAATKSNDTHIIEYKFCGEDGTKSEKLMEYITPILVHQGDGDDGSPTGFIGTLVDITELKDAQGELERLAFYDPLTNLPNRRFIKDALEGLRVQKKGEESFTALALIDLDNFKRVNDSLGHDAGDTLLKVFADRLRKCLSNNDVVARMGGDEFYVLLNDISNKVDVRGISQRISDALSQPVRIKNHVVEVSISMGVAFYPESSTAPEELIRKADIALYRAKENGRGRISYFSDKMDVLIQNRMKMESKLREAVFSNRLEIYLQPQFNTETRKFGWAEVLLRWTDSELGVIQPNQFIPIAEETGIINYIDVWVLRAACQLLRDHRPILSKKGINGLSVNLSAKQFYSKDFLQMIKRTFVDFETAPQTISFEVTESMVIEDIDKAISTMTAIRDIGCSLSLDDFGTGYSSLSYLKRLPIDNLKIDRSFISDIPQDDNDVAITEAIIAMADKLNITVIAEGIETSRQRDFLMSRNCHLMQGYFFAKPMPVSDIVEEREFEPI